MMDFDPLGQLAAQLRLRKRPVFIVGRFRSGTTALWNLLRQSPGTFAIYEPLHDVLPAHLNEEGPADPSHRGVEDYFRELREQRVAVLRHFRAEFGATRLFLAGGEAHPELLTYLKVLLGLAGARVPVLKCVRMDFRLAWLRRNFPHAAIIYLHRNPREQWLSMAAREDPKLRDTRWLSVYQSNAFAANLLLSLPEVMESPSQHPYERAYYLWRISQALGEKYANLNVNFDADLLTGDPNLFIRLAELTGVTIPPEVLAASLCREIPPRAQAPTEKAAMAKMEQRCEAVLERRGLLQAIQNGAIETAWPQAQDLSRDHIREAIDCLSLACSREQGRGMETLAQTREVLRVALNQVAELQDQVEQLRAPRVDAPKQN